MPTELRAVLAMPGGRLLSLAASPDPQLSSVSLPKQLRKTNIAARSPGKCYTHLFVWDSPASMPVHTQQQAEHAQVCRNTRLWFPSPDLEEEVGRHTGSTWGALGTLTSSRLRLNSSQAGRMRPSSHPHQGARRGILSQPEPSRAPSFPSRGREGGMAFLPCI